MKVLPTLFLFFTLITSFGQTTISGKVSDTKGLPIEGAKVYLGGSSDGGTTDL
jgi:hypothetical protein